MTNPLHNVYGSLDVRFEYTPIDGRSILLTTDIEGMAEYALESTDYLPVSLRITTKTESGISYTVCSTELDGTSVDKYCYPIGSGITYKREKIRFYISNQNLSVYFGGRCVYSYTLNHVDYVSDPVIAELSVHGDSLTLLNTVRTELHDYRDAIFIDYEATADSALQSVIQERPVQIFSEPGRKLSFTYNPVKDSLVPPNTPIVKKYTIVTTASQRAASDGLIYFTNVSINVSILIAKMVGFVVRLFRLSNLENGAKQATRFLQKIAIERRHKVSLDIRFDPRIVIADKFTLNARVTGTLTNLAETFIVEDVQMAMSDGAYSMSLEGRREEPDA